MSLNVCVCVWVSGDAAGFFFPPTVFYLNQRDQAVDLDELERILGGARVCEFGRTVFIFIRRVYRRSWAPRCMRRVQCYRSL